MDNLGAVFGPVLALLLVSVVSVRVAILLSVIPGLLATLAILTAIRATPRPNRHDHQPIRLRVRPVMQGQLGRLMYGVAAFELANVAATLLILRATRAPDARPRVELGDQTRPRALHRLQRSRDTREHPRRAPRRPLERVARTHGRRRLLRRRLRRLRLRRPGDRAAWPSPSSPRASASAWSRPRSTVRSPASRHSTAVAAPSACSPLCRASGSSPPARSPACSGRRCRRTSPSCTWRPGVSSHSCCSPACGPAGRRPTPPRRSDSSEARGDATGLPRRVGKADYFARPVRLGLCVALPQILAQVLLVHEVPGASPCRTRPSRSRSCRGRGRPRSGSRASGGRAGRRARDGRRRRASPGRSGPPRPRRTP